MSAWDPPETSHQAQPRSWDNFRPHRKNPTCESSKKFIAAFHQKLQALDEVQIQREYMSAPEPQGTANGKGHYNHFQ